MGETFQDTDLRVVNKRNALAKKVKVEINKWA